MSSDNNVVITPEVHKPRLELMKAPVGCTVTEILRCAIREGKFDASDLPYVEIRINGKLLPRREDALDRCLLDNEIVQISMAVRGDNPLKNAFQLIVQVTAIVVGFYFGPWAAAAVQIAGGLATAALFRNKQDRLADPNSSSALNEQSNQIRRRAPMPLVLGKQRIGFDVAALSYTQNIGNDQWLNVIFGVHYGPCVVEDIKIGETLLKDYPASDYQIEYMLEPGPRNSRLYPGNVFQENFNNKLEFVGIPGGTWETITPLPGAKGADVDITLPAGLSYSTDKGKIRNEEVAGQIQIAEVGTENWQPAPFPGHNTARDKDNQLLPPGSWYLNMKTANAIRNTYSFDLDPTKNWKIRVRAYDRDNDPADHPGHTWDTYLTALRSRFDGKPIVDENLACIAIRIKASGDLGNTLPVISGVVTPIVPVFKNGNWDTHEPSSNQAALLRWCLTDLPAARPLLQDQINATCATVYDLIEARQWEAALHITEEISQEDLMRLCGLAGRFATYWSGEDLCFVGDWEKPIARQIFSASNIQGYKYRREFQDEIHAVLVEFKNVDQDSRADELWVYADGYDASNAELFETYTLQYACKQTRAYKEGRVYLARRELKSETHEWTCAFDSVTSTFGDRVRLSHYSALYGQDSGRVVNRIFNGDKTLVIGIRVDFEAEQISGTSYSVDVRRSDMALVGLLLEPVTGDVSSKNLYFAVPIPVANAPRKDDLVVFGETNLVTEDVEIDSFEPQSRNEVRISASPYVATQIEAAETGPIPSLPTNLLPKPQVPRVRILQRYGNPEGVEVVFDIEIKDANTVRGFVARWRYSGPDSPWNTIGILPPEARSVRTPPIQRPAYDPDDPIDAITYVDVQIVTLSMRGDYSQPATASNIEVRKEVQKLTGFDAIGVGRPAPDGSSKAAIAVIADPVTAGDIQYLDVEAAVLAQDAEYVSLGSLPASNPIGDFTEIEGGQDYVVRGRWRTQDNWYSDWEYVGLEGNPVHVPGGQNVANDAVNIGGRPVADVIAELTTIGQLVNDTAQAVQNLQDLYGDTASAAASAAAAASSAADAAAQAALAEGKAQDAAASAVAAQAFSDSANTSAAASAASAATAAAHVTDVEQLAAAATAAKLAAETARGQAQTAATQAASSRDDAAGSAASASTSAIQAANSRDAAAGSASSAAGSASLASTKANEAGVSASAAMASQVSASTARDEAMLALMQQGRTNLAARENASAGSIITNPTPSLSGWGFTLTGAGVGVERSIFVGPLKVSTPYSVSFMARRSVGTGPSPLNVDLHPDTLPERVFQIDENWSQIKWEGISSSHADMTLSTVRLRFFRSPLAAGIQFEVTDIKLEEGSTATAWTPSPKDAATSALAAATSASSAQASETAAGASASSASGSATNAATAAGQAQTYSNQASASAASAAGSANTASQASGTAVTARDQAVGAKNDAQSAAATAIAQASSASASASSAQISANLAASVGLEAGANILANSSFSSGLAGWTTSTWFPSQPYAGFGTHAFCSLNGTNSMISDTIPVSPGFFYTISADARRFATGGVVSIYFQWLDAAGNWQGDSAHVQWSDYHNFGENNRKSVSVQPPSSATQGRIIIAGIGITGVATNGLAVRQIKVEVGNKATMWRDDRQLTDVSSQLQITASTTADLATRMATARFEVTAAAGGNLAQLKIRADTSGSLAGLVAQAVSFSNTISGQVVEVMKIISGSVYITGKLFMGSAGQIELDPAYPLILWKFGNARLAIGQLPNDNLFFWFGQGASTAITDMRKNNAKVWFDTTGNSYWGGSIVAGTISNSGQGSLITVPASFTLGPFGTNGGPITVVWSYDYSRTGRRWGDQTGGVAGTTTALVRFYRKIGSAAETLIDSMTVTGTFNAYYDPEPVPGQPSGTQGQTFFTEYMGGSRTYTDNAGGTQPRTYRVEVVSRSLRSVPGQSNGLDGQNQAYGITSSE